MQIISGVQDQGQEVTRKRILSSAQDQEHDLHHTVTRKRIQTSSQGQGDETASSQNRRQVQAILPSQGNNEQYTATRKHINKREVDQDNTQEYNHWPSSQAQAAEQVQGHHRMRIQTRDQDQPQQIRGQSRMQAQAQEQVQHPMHGQNREEFEDQVQDYPPPSQAQQGYGQRGYQIQGSFKGQRRIEEVQTQEQWPNQGRVQDGVHVTATGKRFKLAKPIQDDKQQNTTTGKHFKPLASAQEEEQQSVPKATSTRFKIVNSAQSNPPTRKSGFAKKV